MQLPRLAGRAHDSQASVHAVLQQTPSVQNPLAHSTPEPQVAPLSFGGTQALDEQMNPAAQSASWLHCAGQPEEALQT